MLILYGYTGMLLQQTNVHLHSVLYDTTHIKIDPCVEKGGGGGNNPDKGMKDLHSKNPYS
jgi:hypothetical protein